MSLEYLQTFGKGIQSIGNLNALKTSTKATVIGAINEIHTAITEGKIDITIDEAQLPKATSYEAGIVQLNNTLTSDSTSQAASANTVKQLKEMIDGLSVQGGDTQTVEIPTASTSHPGIVQLVDSSSSKSTSMAPTALALSQTYDLARQAIELAGKGSSSTAVDATTATKGVVRLSSEQSISDSLAATPHLVDKVKQQLTSALSSVKSDADAAVRATDGLDERIETIVNSLLSQSSNNSVQATAASLMTVAADDTISTQETNFDTSSSTTELVRVDIKAATATEYVAEGDAFHYELTGDTTLTATVFRNSVNIVPLDTDLVWEKINRKTGVHDTAWEDLYSRKGNVVTIDTDDYLNVYDIKCHYVGTTFQFVNNIYVQNAINRMANTINKLKSTHSIIVYITDTHYEAAAIENPSVAKKASLGHIHNVVELTRHAPVDLVVHGGDLIDGKGSRSTSLSNMNDVVTSMSHSNAPVMYAKGNHDDNLLGDYRYYSNDGTHVLSAVDTSNIMRRDYLVDGISYNMDDNSPYGFYDIASKKQRIIVLDAWDIRNDLKTSTGVTKYQSRKYGGFQQKQISWLAATLQSTPANYSVSVFSHIALGEALSSNTYEMINEPLIIGLLKAYQNGTAYSSADDVAFVANVDHPASIVHSFASRGKGSLMGIFSGHIHRDIAKRIGFDETPTLMTNCSYAYGDADDKTRRILGTVNEDLFDVIAINNETNNIQMHRFGAGLNGRMLREYSGGLK